LRCERNAIARQVLEVFLSSTALDLAAYRDAVYARLARIEMFHCVRQEDFGARNAEAVAFCSERARAADLFVGIVGMRRGWEPEGDSANLRRILNPMGAMDAIDFLLDKLRNTKNNGEFFDSTNT
jgi:hypothetical protein